MFVKKEKKTKFLISCLEYIILLVTLKLKFFSLGWQHNSSGNGPVLDM